MTLKREYAPTPPPPPQRYQDLGDRLSQNTYSPSHPIKFHKHCQTQCLELNTKY